jgi:hypothetical protein
MKLVSEATTGVFAVNVGSLERMAPTFCLSTETDICGCTTQNSEMKCTLSSGYIPKRAHCVS